LLVRGPFEEAWIPYGGDHPEEGHQNLPFWRRPQSRKLVDGASPNPLVQAFLPRGETPMLLGRPISKALGMPVDFLNDRIKFNDATGVLQHLGATVSICCRPLRILILPSSAMVLHYL
jgi:hypothetical protein